MRWYNFIRALLDESDRERGTIQKVVRVNGAIVINARPGKSASASAVQDDEVTQNRRP